MRDAGWTALLWIAVLIDGMIAELRERWRLWLGVVVVGLAVAWVCMGCGVAWNALGANMDTRLLPQECTHNPSGTVSEGWGFPCGRSSETGWCRATGRYVPIEDECEVRFCPEYEDADRESLIVEEKCHCSCKRIRRAYDHGDGCFERCNGGGP